MDPIALRRQQHARAPAIPGSAARRSARTAWPSASTWSSANRAGASDRRDGVRCAGAKASGCAAAAASALSAHISGLLASGAIVRMLEDGSVLLNTGAVDIGQGSNTVLTQICAEALQVPVERVAIASPDTDGSPYNWGTTASRVDLRRRPLGGRRRRPRSRRSSRSTPSEMLECAVDDLELLPGGKVAHQGRAAAARVSFADISGRAHWAAGGPIIGTHSWVFDQKTFDPKRAVALGLPFPQIGIFSFSALVVEVEVDEATGKVRVVARLVGLRHRPRHQPGAWRAARSKARSCRAWATRSIEEMVWDGARLANPSLMDYKIPTIAELPETLRAYLVESDEPSGPFGAKSVGELGINGVAAAIANAVADATGVRLRQLPMTGERVLRGLARNGPRAMKPARRSAAGTAVGARHRDLTIGRSRAVPASRAAIVRVRRRSARSASSADTRGHQAPATCDVFARDGAPPVASPGGPSVSEGCDRSSRRAGPAASPNRAGLDRASRLDGATITTPNDPPTRRGGRIP